MGGLKYTWTLPLQDMSIVFLSFLAGGKDGNMVLNNEISWVEINL